MFDEALDLLTVDKLKTRLALRHTSEKPTRKADIIAVLRRHLLSERCREYWEELDELERQAVSETVHSWSGSFDATRFRAKYGGLPTYFKPRVSPFRLPGEQPDRSLVPLFFCGGLIPEELCRQLAAFVPEPASDALQTLDDDLMPREYETKPGQKCPIAVLAMEAVALHDLSAVLYLVADGQVRVSDKTSLPGAASVRKLEGALMAGDYYSPDQELDLERWAGGAIRPIRPFAWPLLLQTGGVGEEERHQARIDPQGQEGRG